MIKMEISLLGLDDASIYRVCTQADLISLKNLRRTNSQVRKICGEELVQFKALAFAYALIFIREYFARERGIKVKFKELRGVLDLFLASPLDYKRYWSSQGMGASGFGAFDRPVPETIAESPLAIWMKDRSLPITFNIKYIQYVNSIDGFAKLLRDAEVVAMNSLPQGFSEFEQGLYSHDSYTVRSSIESPVFYTSKKYEQIGPLVKDLVKLLTTYEIEYIEDQEDLIEMATEIEELLILPGKD